MAKTLYLCYFGLREPLVQTQVLPYLREIMKDGISVSLLTFEPAETEAEKSNKGAREKEFGAIRESLATEGIEWEWLTYHKRISPVATAYDIFRGTLFVWRKLRREEIDILHGRVHVPTLMGALARKLSGRKPKILFDIRGFFPEEYVDAGTWPENGWLYHAAKRVERWLLKQADGFVVLTEKAREILFPESAASGFDKLGRPVEVIPCCVDLEKFASADLDARVAMRRELGVGERKVFAYVGSFGGWYLSDEMFDLFEAIRKRDRTSFVLVLTQRNQAVAAEKLRAKGFGDDDFFVGNVLPTEIPRFLNASDASVSFIKRCYSKQASSPTKNAEYLACGLPIIANSGVGDVDELITRDGVGVLVETFDRDVYNDALERLDLLGDASEKCRSSARERFDLTLVGGPRYRRMYERLLGRVRDKQDL